MNIQQIRESLKLKWVSYYYQNRSWLVKLRIWRTYDGSRRPSSSFILAAVSVLEPQLEQILPFVVELNSNPDEIVAALGLNFNPEEQLHLVKLDSSTAPNQLCIESSAEILPNTKPLTPSKVAVEAGKNQLVPSVTDINEFKNEVQLQTLPEQIFSSISEEENNSVSLLACVTSEIESTSNSISSVTTAIPEVESKNTANPLFAFFSPEVESESKFFRSVPLATEVEPKSSHTLSVAIATHDRKSSSQPVPMVAFIDSKVEKNGSSYITASTDVESKGKFVTIPQQDIQLQMNSPSPNRIRNLANWIDDFCQGKGWNSEEANFTH